MKHEELENNFTYHAPSKEKKEMHEEIRETAYNFAVIINTLPESREKALALTKLEECVMWANATIARNV